MSKEDWSLNLARAKICALAMMGCLQLLPQPQVTQWMSLPVQCIDGNGTQWPLMALEECCRQAIPELASRALNPWLAGERSEQACEAYERSLHSHPTAYNVFRRPQWKLVVVEACATASPYSSNRSSAHDTAATHFHLVASVDLGPRLAPLLFLLSTWLGKGETENGETQHAVTGGGGKWTGGWSGKSNPSEGMRQVFAAAYALRPEFDPRNYSLLRTWYEMQTLPMQESMWAASTKQLVSVLPELKDRKLGGDQGIADVATVLAMDWVVRPNSDVA